MSAPYSLTAEERSLRSSAAAHAMHALHDGHATTRAARRAANVTRFEDQVDPDRILAPDERARRVEHARKSHMQLLALKSARARRERASANRAAA